MNDATASTLVNLVRDQVDLILRGAATGRFRWEVEAVGAQPIPGEDAIDLRVRIRPKLERGS